MTGGPSISTMSKDSRASDSSSASRGPDSNSAGFGGSGPDAISVRPLVSVPWITSSGWLAPVR
jgi:hypothetical protein